MAQLARKMLGWSSTAKADDKCLICDSEIPCSFLASSLIENLRLGQLRTYRRLVLSKASASEGHCSLHEAHFQTPSGQNNMTAMAHGIAWVQDAVDAVLAKHLATVNFVKKLTAGADVNPVASVCLGGSNRFYMFYAWWNRQPRFTRKAPTEQQRGEILHQGASVMTDHIWSCSTKR